jgi:hypothetical protein
VDATARRFVAEVFAQTSVARRALDVPRHAGKVLAAALRDERQHHRIVVRDVAVTRAAFHRPPS